MAMQVSRWNDMRVRVGWTIRLNNGRLAIVTWKGPNDQCYTAKVLEPQPTEQEQSSS